MKTLTALLLICTVFVSPLLNAASKDYLRISGFRWSFVEKTEKVYLGFSTRFSRKLTPSEKKLLYRSHLLFLVVNKTGTPLGYLIVAAEYGSSYAKSNLLYQYTVTELPRDSRRLIVLGVTDLITAIGTQNLDSIQYSWAKMKIGHINGVISASLNWKPGQQYARYSPVASLFVPFYDENDELQTDNLIKMESYMKALNLSWEKLFVKDPNQRETEEDSEDEPVELNVDALYEDNPEEMPISSKSTRKKKQHPDSNNRNQKQHSKQKRSNRNY